MRVVCDGSEARYYGVKIHGYGFTIYDANHKVVSSGSGALTGDAGAIGEVIAFAEGASAVAPFLRADPKEDVEFLTDNGMVAVVSEMLDGRKNPWHQNYLKPTVEMLREFRGRIVIRQVPRAAVSVAHRLARVGVKKRKDVIKDEHDREVQYTMETRPE
jgi:hypothetical protein